MPRGQSSDHRALAHLLAALSSATPKQAKEPIFATPNAAKKMTKKFESFLEVCDREGEVDRGMTIKETYEAFLPCFEQYKNGDKKLRIHLTGMTKYALSQEEAFFVLAYTSGTSKWINGDLRRGDVFSSECKKVFANCLDKALSKMPSFNKSLVYRMQIGVDSDTEIAQFRTQVNLKFVVPYYLSTAKENYNNSKVTWLIQTLDSGSKGKDISDLSNHQFEKEVLFERNSKFQVTEIDEHNNRILMNEIKPDASVDFSINDFY